MRTAAYTAIFLAFLAAPAPAEAAPRRVVVLNAAAERDAGAEAAGRVRAALAESEALAPLSPGDLSRALEQPLPERSPEARAIARAEGLIEDASALVYFENKRARLTLERAEQLLLDVTPTERVVELLVRLNFHLGLVHLEEQNRGLALTAFGVVHRLDPDRPPLDPARYKPDIVKTFAEAGKQTKAPPSAKAQVSATFDGVDVYVDGERAGTAPLDVELVPGAHYVVAVSPLYRPSGARIDLADGESVAENLPLERWSAEQRARRLRRALQEGRTSFRDAARDAVQLTGADAAVLLRGEGEVEAAVYEGRTGRLSFWRRADDRVGEMLGLLVPVPAPALAEERRFPTGPTRPPERPWYQTPLGIAGLVSSGVVVSVLGVLALTLDSGGGEGDTAIRCCL